MSSTSANENDPLLVITDDNSTNSNSRASLNDSNSSGDHVAACNNFILDTVVDGTEYIVEGARELRNDIVEGVEEVAENVKDAVVEEVQEAKESLMEELNDADQGEMFFLDMGLTRNLSILPSDVVDASAAAATEISQPTTIGENQSLREGSGEKPYGDAEVGLPSKEEVTKDTEGQPPLTAYLLLFSAVVSMSSIGPLLDMQESVDSMMKIYWRMTGTWMILIPFAVYSVRNEGLSKFPVDTSIFQLIAKMIISAVGYATMCLGFVVALEYTSVGNATIFSNSQALILLAGKLLVGDPVSASEGTGALVAFAGAVLCSRDSFEASSVGSDAIWGDFYALVSAIGGVGYMVYAKNLRQHMPVYQFMFLNMFLGSVVVAFIMFVTNKTMTFDRHINHGMFGWMNLEQDRLPLEIVMIIVCNLLGAMGYARSMQYFDNLTISVACLMEPVMAEFIAFELDVGFLPGWKGW
eukprot:CAMPEP_0202454834 /NCGR_PEP_ID=MMETSP1360-20130828/12473_1 /ASSEMBLY_ACC=CAM_ASM_000848 /TAXON_ID=515479 /ORGANISM="Licmophora paradoxa, Strain CCMP2313" /LENGTH=467 /DNA_ID=CAMNT_0049074245 /DNA_START=221 /DNA_END=1621 /DNA_ORIENTATION=-